MTDTIEAPPETYRTFSGVIAFVGTPTSDHRMLAPDAALSFRAPPQPLLWMRSTGQGGHSDAVQVGVIEDMHADAEKVYGSGYLLNTPDADLAAEQLAHGITRPSIDIGASRWRMTDGDGKELDEDSWFELSLAEMERVMTTFIEAEIMAFTLVALPAFGETGLTLGERESRDLTVVAASAPAFREYPAGHFSDPQLTGPTLPTLLDDGRVVGHVACWGSCHRSVQTQCVQAPHSPTDYSHFHTSPAVRLDDGTRLPVGRLTVGTGHASDNLDGVPAQAHYDNTGSCWAIVRVGEDAHGIWFSGVPAPWASEDVIEEGLASPLSGDWRDFGQGLELVAALSVNTPGFAARGRDDELGRPVALVAALGPAPTIDRVAYLSRDDVKTAVAEALAEQKFAAEREAVLARAAQVAPVKSVRERIGDMLAAL